jgi:hypothetical protein
VLKQAPPDVRVRPTLTLTPRRAAAEALAYREHGRWAPEWVPRLYFFRRGASSSPSRTCRTIACGEPRSITASATPAPRAPWAASRSAPRRSAPTMTSGCVPRTACASARTRARFRLCRLPDRGRSRSRRHGAGGSGDRSPPRRAVALKIIAPERTRDPAAVARSGPRRARPPRWSTPHRPALRWRRVRGRRLPRDAPRAGHRPATPHRRRPARAARRRTCRLPCRERARRGACARARAP